MNKKTKLANMHDLNFWLFLLFKHRKLFIKFLIKTLKSKK